MSMEDWDFGYYGKGLDGYVHFRQGIKEIESHAPYSKCRHGRDDSLDDLDDLDEYDDPEDDLFYEREACDAVGEHDEGIRLESADCTDIFAGG